jgi:acetyl esterase/lipase
MSTRILVVTGDGGESYEALYAVHRLSEAGYSPVVAAPSARRKAKVVVVLRRYDGMIHGFFQMGRVIAAGRRAIEQAAAFARDRLIG